MNKNELRRMGVDIQFLDSLEYNNSFIRTSCGMKLLGIVVSCEGIKNHRRISFFLGYFNPVVSDSYLLKVRAITQASTRIAPAFFKVLVSSFSVLPVVSTSSTSKICWSLT